MSHTLQTHNKVHFVLDEDQDFESSPHETEQSLSGDRDISVIPEVSSSANGCVDQLTEHTSITHYEHKFKEFVITEGLEGSTVDGEEIVDRTITSNLGTTSIHEEQRFHLERRVRRKSMDSSTGEV